MGITHSLLNSVVILVRQNQVYLLLNNSAQGIQSLLIRVDARGLLKRKLPQLHQVPVDLAGQ